MTRDTGSTNSETHELETDPRDGGCPECGRETTLVPLEDFGLERGQLCPVHGVVHAARRIATDGGERPDECDCIDAHELPCFNYWRAGFETVNPEVSG